MPEKEDFTHDEVVLMRFMVMCQETCDPDNYRKFLEVTEWLMSIRPGLRDGCFDRLNSYVGGSPDWSSGHHSISSPAS